MLSYVDISFSQPMFFRDFSRETVLSGDERGETSAVRRLDNPTLYSFKLGSEWRDGAGGTNVSCPVKILAICQLSVK